MSDDTHRIGNALMVNTHGLMKMRCRRPDSSRFSTRFASGHGSASAMARTRAASRGIADEREPAAVAVERLERLEAEEPGVAERADRPAVEGGAERMRAVFDHEQAVATGNRHDRGPCRRAARTGASARRRASPV